MSFDVNDITVNTSMTKQGKIVPKCNGSTSDPTVTDDINASYDIGDIWVNTTSDESFICLDNAAGAAVWKTTTFEGSTSSVSALIQAKRTTDLSLTTTLQDVNFDTTDIETDDSIIDHDNTNRDRVYVHTTSYFYGSLNIELKNTSTQDRTATIELRLNDTTVLSSETFEINKSSTEMVTRTLFLPPVASGSFFTIRMSASATGVDLKSGARLCLFNTVGAKGDTGATGAAGADGDITWEGNWVSQNYTANQAVHYSDGSSYVCHTNTTSNQPPTDNAYWDMLAQKGDTGSGGGYIAIDKTRDNGSAQNITITTYETQASFIFDGANFTISEASFNIYTTATSAEARLYDVTNSQEICSVSTTSSSTGNIASTTTINNIPTGKAKIEIQVKKTGGGGDAFFFSAGVRL